MPISQTIQFETVSVSEIGSGPITAFLYSGTALVATLGSIAENGTLKGRYTGVVNDIATGKYRLVVKLDGYTVNEPDEYVDLVLAVGTYVAYRAAVLDPATILAVADQVWDETTSGHTTAGTYGGRIVRATNSNTEVQITGLHHIAADIHELQSGVITAGDFADNSLTASALATDAVTEIQSGLASQSSVDTLTSYVDTEVAAIKAKTDNLPSDPADASDIASSFSTVNTKLDTIDDFLDTEIAAIKAKTDNLPADPADQSLVETAITNATALLATPAQVNAQVLDVLSVDTFAELSAPPAATSSLKDKLTWLFMYARNKVTQTALARTLYRDDTTTVAGTSATSDNGTTFTKGEDA